MVEKQTKSQQEKIDDVQHQVKLLKVRLREKEKQVSLATLKIKELKRNLRFNTLKPLPQTPGNLTLRKRKRRHARYRGEYDLKDDKDHSALSDSKEKSIPLENLNSGV